MNIPEEITDIKKHLVAGELRQALDKFTNMLIVHAEIGMSIQLEEIRTDYERMISYWKQGYEDNTRETYHAKLIANTLKLLVDAGQRYDIMHDSRLNSEYFRVRNSGKEWSVNNIRKMLEMYVGELTMTELLPANKREVRYKQLQKDQHEVLSQIFDYIRTSEQWDEATATAMEEIFISPTIDTISQQTLIAAVILNNICWFDYQKERMLMNVYMKADDEKIRQRALIGWTLCMKSEEYLICDADTKDKLLNKILEDKHCVEELEELQIQLAYCLNAENDKDEINSTIMPDIMKNSSVRITGGQITEITDDPMEDIINPGASERKMEELEEKIKKITDMQKQGHDIFYAGFSQMKRFTFFDKIMHWVMPFYNDHPYIAENFNRDDTEAFLEMMKRTPFCDSDKYSFMLALQQFISKIPANLLEAMKGGQMHIMGYDEGQTHDAPAVIRRSFLQSLYRFFKVYPGRDMFPLPFDTETAGCPVYLFFAKTVFSQTVLQDKFPGMAMYFIKRKMTKDAGFIMANYDCDNPTYEAFMTMAKLSPEQSVRLYSLALESRPDDEKATRGLARAYFTNKEYDEAFKLYDQLTARKPDNSQLLLSKLATMVHIPSQHEEAKNILYRITYEQPENIYATRLLGYVLILLGKTDHARQIYEKLCNGTNATADDKLYLGICLLSQRKYEEAAKTMAGCKEDSIVNTVTEMSNTLLNTGITEFDIKLFLENR